MNSPTLSFSDSRWLSILALHQSGQLDKAASLIKELLQSFPENPQLLSQMGTIDIQRGQIEEGVRTLEKSLKIEPRQPFALSNCALGLEALGRLQDALAYDDRAITLKPDYAEAHHNRGAILRLLQRPMEALASYDRAISLNSQYAEFHINRGVLLQELGRPEEALAAYDRCISLRTGYAEAHFNRGNVLKELRRLKEALESYGQAITLNPRYVQAYNNRGTVFYELRQWTEALESYDRAVALKPDNAIAFNNRGNALKEIGRWEEALENYDRAIALKPEYVRAYNNRGVALHGLRRWEEARASYDQAISLDSNSPAPYWNKAQLENLLGNFEEGWRLFEWRWKEVQKAELRGFPQPLWLGAESLAGKTILIHAEQGLGDCIQFCRYVPLLELKGAQVVLEVPRPLRALIASLPGSRQLVERGETLPPVDFQCPMLSLPLALGTRVETIPRNVPYLFSDPQKELFWQARLGSRTRPRIGLVWSGRAEHSNDQHRSLSLKAFSSLLELPYEFHSLQKEYREKDQAWLSASTQLKDHAADLKDFSDTAALISQMDLVLSVDTSVAHLTGALGRPLWLLLPYLPDYRWFLDREDSPWYPTAVLFRQPAAGDWESVILKVVDRMRREFK